MLTIKNISIKVQTGNHVVLVGITRLDEADEESHRIADHSSTSQRSYQFKENEMRNPPVEYVPLVAARKKDLVL